MVRDADTAGPRLRPRSSAGRSAATAASRQPLRRGNPASRPPGAPRSGAPALPLSLPRAPRSSRSPAPRRCTSPPARTGRRCAASSWTSIVTRRAPDAPSGCPRAIAPPLGFTRAGSRPSSSMQATDWLAKASLSSTTSRSAGGQPGPLQRLADRRHRARCPSRPGARRPPPWRGPGPSGAGQARAPDPPRPGAAPRRRR